MTEKLKLEKEAVVVAEAEAEAEEAVYPRPDNVLLFFRKMSEMRKVISAKALAVDGYNEHQKYEYSSAKQYKTILNEACMEVGMEMYTLMTGVETINLPNDASKQHLTRIHVTIVLIDLDTGHSVGFPIIADGCDSLDKGIYKAETMAIKSFVQTTFLRSDKDEIDPESAGKKAPATFTTTADRAVKAKATVAGVNLANEELIDRIYDAVLAVRKVEQDYLQEGDTLEKFNNGTLTEVEATSLLLNIEEYAEEIGVQL